MTAKHRRLLLSAWLVVFCILGCYSQVDLVATPSTIGTSGIATLSVLQTMEAMTHAAAFTPSPAAGTPVVGLPVGTLSPAQNAISASSTVCRSGPGRPYKVVSALRPGDHVQIVGRASIPGWDIVQDPIHLTPCWMPSGDLQLDPNLDVMSLPLVTPPPPPTPTATLAPWITPSPTKTP